MSRISEAVGRLKAGGMVVLTDDEDRENEGDLVLAAEFATGEAINFMATHGRGLVCLALDPATVDRLALPPMSADNRTPLRTAFTVSIEAREGVTTGISAFDRARTIQAAVSPSAAPADLVSPGHVFPLRAAPGGVLARQGHTEGSIELMRLAGLRSAAVICEILRTDGHMARKPDLHRFAETHDLPMLSIAELVAHRRTEDIALEPVATARLPSRFGAGAFTAHAFRNRADGREYLALATGRFDGRPLVRVHSECLTGDALGSLRCDCGEQLQTALKRIGDSEGGVLVYLAGQEGRGIGLANKIRAYALQDEGLDTVEANRALGFADDLRDYSVAAAVLKALGCGPIRLLSNNPRKAAGLRACGIEVVEELPLAPAANRHNAAYLAAKRERLGHRTPPGAEPDRSAA